MNREIKRNIKVSCSDDGASMKVGFGDDYVVERLQEKIERMLVQRKVGVTWVKENQEPEVKIRVVEADQGNQFLRYMFPFIAPAFVEVEGEISMNGDEARTFNYIRRAQVGIFGGDGRSMINRCTRRIAQRIAEEIEYAIN